MDYHQFLSYFPMTYLGRGPTGQRSIALTFDDGPGGATPELLSLLRELQVKASFFCLGAAAQKHADVVRRIVRDGHDVGNHSFSHIDPTGQSLREFWNTQVVPATAALESFVARPVRIYRPPYGEIRPEQVDCLGRSGYTVVGWSIDPCDWLNPHEPDYVERVVETVVSQAHPGAIVLLHDGDDGHYIRRGILDVVRELVPRLRRSGFDFVGVTELLQQRNDGLLPGARLMSAG